MHSQTTGLGDLVSVREVNSVSLEVKNRVFMSWDVELKSMQVKKQGFLSETVHLFLDSNCRPPPPAPFSPAHI